MRPSKAPQRAFGDYFGAVKLKQIIIREPSVTLLAREARSKRLFDVFEARAQTRTCKNHPKTYGFLGFFVCRVFFEKVSAVDSKNTKIS